LLWGGWEAIRPYSLDPMLHACGSLDWRLESLPPELFDLEGLEELSLAGNCLTSLPEDIGRLTSLKRLQLAGENAYY